MSIRMAIRYPRFARSKIIARRLCLPALIAPTFPKRCHGGSFHAIILDMAGVPPQYVFTN